LPSIIWGYSVLSIFANVLRLPNKPPIHLSTFKNKFHFLLIKENYQYHLKVRENLGCYFWVSGDFRYPLWGTSFRLKVISVNPGFLTCHNVFQKGYFVVCCSFWSLVGSRWTYFAATQFLYNLYVKTVWRDVPDIQHPSATSPTVNRQLERMSARTRSMNSSSVETEIHPECGLSSIAIRPRIFCATRNSSYDSQFHHQTLFAASQKAQ
jgi:hypothetical protein